MSYTDQLPERPRASGMETVFPANSRIKPFSRKAVWVGFGLVAGCLIGLFTSPSPVVAGGWTIALMVILIFLSVPVALALSVPSLLGIFAVSGVPASINVLSTAPFNTVSNWTYSVLPAFIFMSMLLTHSGMTAKIYEAAGRWFSWMPGGIGVGTTAAGAGLASVSGSSIGMTYALAKAGIPEMLGAGYHKRMAIGTVIVAGIPGSVIPPSILLVVYAGIASVPVGPQLIAGAVPGFLIAATFGVFVLVIGALAPGLVGGRSDSLGGGKRVLWSERFRALANTWGFPVIMVVLFGGLFSGAFTPTEAGAAAALTALAIAVIYSRKNKPILRVREAAYSTISASAAVFFLIIGAEMLTRLLAITGIASRVTEFIVGLGLGRVSFLLLLIVVFIIMGMFFDTLAMMLLTVPLLMPTLTTMDINPIWFGVFMVIVAEVGMVTPPVGILAFIIHSICQDPKVNLGQDIGLKDVFIAVTWFVPAVALFLVLFIMVPEMALWLPGVIG